MYALGENKTADKMLNNTLNSRLRDVSHELFNISTELHRLNELLIAQEEKSSTKYEKENNRLRSLIELTDPIKNKAAYLDHTIRGTIEAANSVSGHVWFAPEDKNTADGWYPAERISLIKEESEGWDYKKEIDRMFSDDLK